MAWLDSRIWCHPKITGVPKSARWAYVAAIAYSDGFGTEGVLTRGQLRTLDCLQRDRQHLIRVGLWIDAGDGAILINDWTAHNGDRDKKRQQARERQRRKREREAQESRVTERDGERDQSRDVTRDSGVTDSVTSRARPMTGEGVTGEEEPELRAVVGEDHDDEPGFDEPTAQDLEFLQTITPELKDLPL